MIIQNSRPVKIKAKSTKKENVNTPKVVLEVKRPTNSTMTYVYFKGKLVAEFTFLIDAPKPSCPFFLSIYGSRKGTYFCQSEKACIDVTKLTMQIG